MKEFRVDIRVEVYVSVYVDAESVEEAESKAANLIDDGIWASDGSIQAFDIEDAVELSVEF